MMKDIFIFSQDPDCKDYRRVHKKEYPTEQGDMIQLDMGDGNTKECYPMDPGSGWCNGTTFSKEKVRSSRRRLKNYLVKAHPHLPQQYNIIYSNYVIYS